MEADLEALMTLRDGAHFGGTNKEVKRFSLKVHNHDIPFLHEHDII
jgi:hypothetical protein